MNDVIRNIKRYNPKKKITVFIVFGDRFRDTISNKKFHPVIIKLFIRGRVKI